MALRRFDHWPELLAAFFAQHQKTPFAWGRFDCALFAADAIHVMTGADLAEDFRFQYDSALSAKRKMKEFCGGGLEAVAEKICAAQGMAEIPVAQAQRGDLVMVNEALMDEAANLPRLGLLGIVYGSGLHALVPSADGLLGVPMEFCRRAWRVG